MKIKRQIKELDYVLSEQIKDKWKELNEIHKELEDIKERLKRLEKKL